MNRLHDTVHMSESRNPATSGRDAVLAFRVRFYSWIFLALVGRIEAIFGRPNL